MKKSPKYRKNQQSRSLFESESTIESLSKMGNALIAKGINPIICKQGYRGHPLTDEQKKSNRIKSQIRSRVEHVFGFIERSMGELVFRGVGIIRVKAAVAMTNLTYNIARLVQIKRYHPDWLSAS